MPKKHIDIKRGLLNFANWFEKNITDEQFDFKQVVTKWHENEVVDDNGRHPCGVVCCAAGWMPTYHAEKSGRDDEMYWMLPNNGRVASFLFKGERLEFAELMTKYFGIPEFHVEQLFIPFNEENDELNIDDFLTDESIYSSWHHQKGEVWIIDGMPMATVDATVSDIVFMIREYVKRYEYLNDLITTDMLMSSADVVEEINEILMDERIHYEPANYQTNGPLALIQVDLKARLFALQDVLGVPREIYKPGGKS